MIVITHNRYGHNKMYRIKRLGDCNGTPIAISEWYYKGRWHDLKNYNIAFDLARLYINATNKADKL